MDVQRTGAALGAEIIGVDLRQPFDDAVFSVIDKALLDHHVVLIRAPGMTPDQHIALGRAFGEVEVHTFFPNLGAGHEQVSVIDSKDGLASFWHTDETFLQFPPLGTLLHAQIVPGLGGDTLFANTQLAYECLSEGMKQYLEGLSALNDMYRVVEVKDRRGQYIADDLGPAAGAAAARRFVHPIVRTHPETGAKCLFVNPTYTQYIVGLPEDESDGILAFLFRHTTRERFVYRHQWTPGDLVIWDNRCTMHNVMDDFEGRRLMHRVSVVGDRPN